MITEDEYMRLKNRLSGILNYESEDPHEPIDPITYLSPEGDTCLHISARQSDLETVDLLCRAGIDVNGRGDMGQTALQIAAREKNIEICRVLLKHGADSSLVDDFGRVADLTILDS